VILNLVLVTFIIGSSLILLEWATIFFHIPKPLSRKIAHVGNSLLIVSLSFLFDWQVFIYIGVIFFCILLALRLYRPLKSLSDRSRESIGEIVFPLGIAAAAFICQTYLDFTVAVLILGVSDTIAFYVGNSFKSRTLLFNKTLLGSTGFFLSVFIICLFATSPLNSLMIALSLAFVEIVSPKGLDNLSVPGVAALLLIVL